MTIFANKKYKKPIKILTAFDNESFKHAFSQIEDLRKSHYLIGYIRYEAKDIFFNKKIKSKLPLLYFEVHCQQGKPLEQIDKTNHYIESKAIIDYTDYKKVITRIKKEIAEGNTYQVNYTYDYKIKSDINGLELFNFILPRQKTPYGAYIKNAWEEILSFSPELFFELEGNKIKTKPMKGTIKRGENEKEDQINIEFLKNDIKNRAENVMIVDLLRNDLGKIAKTGTVKVDKLFEIETHSTLHQMTSEVTAELNENTTLYQIFEALFPCGSVTGAPKINTMEIIDKTEIGKRGVYCGAIGLITPEKTIFSVPIRILQRALSNKDLNEYIYRVGGAIVWDSTAKEEWEETLTKTKFLNQNFKLVETMLVQNSKIKNKAAHFKRMKSSAKELGFAFNSQILKLIPEKDGILRILLLKDGSFEIEYLPLNKIETSKVTISKATVNSKNKLLKHKTTYRPWYENTKEKIENKEIFDEIFFNEKGELTEGSRSNIILQIGSKLYTPPASCGLLKGILRNNLLKNKKVKEKKLYLNDFKKAEKIYCINSVRGIVEVTVDL